MTINEACIKVLTELGGKAPLKLICLKVQEIVVFRGQLLIIVYVQN